MLPHISTFSLMENGGKVKTSLHVRFHSHFDAFRFRLRAVRYYVGNDIRKTRSHITTIGHIISMEQRVSRIFICNRGQLYKGAAIFDATGTN